MTGTYALQKVHLDWVIIDTSTRNGLPHQRAISLEEMMPYPFHSNTSLHSFPKRFQHPFHIEHFDLLYRPKLQQSFLANGIYARQQRSLRSFGIYAQLTLLTPYP